MVSKSRIEPWQTSTRHFEDNLHQENNYSRLKSFNFQEQLNNARNGMGSFRASPSLH